MDAVLFEQLLYQEESDSLDFKRDQYPFDGANDGVKSELLKDILAFANSWKRVDGYILIGVEDVKGGKSIVVGVTDDLDDAKLQQFVNSKLNKPIAFSYEPFIFDGKRVGVIKISVQQRPFYLAKNYGKLEREKVYIRRGSSTDTARPDEIALMGVNSIDLSKPTIELEFANNKSKERLGKELVLKSLLFSYDEGEINKLRGSIHSAAFGYLNSDYYIEKAKYIYETSILKNLSFWIKNIGEILLSNVSLKIFIKCDPSIVVKDEVDYPGYPSRNSGLDALRYLNFKPNSIIQKNRIDVTLEANETNKKWLINADFGDIRPKEEVWAKDFFCLGAYESRKLEIEGLVFADNLIEPIKIPLSISFEVDKKDLDFDQLYQD